MNLGNMDLDTWFEYMIVYKDERDNTINTSTMNESALRMNYKQMKESGDVIFLGIYQKLNDSQLSDIITK